MSKKRKVDNIWRGNLDFVDFLTQEKLDSLSLEPMFGHHFELQHVDEKELESYVNTIPLL